MNLATTFIGILKYNVVASIFLRHRFNRDEINNVERLVTTPNGLYQPARRREK